MPKPYETASKDYKLLQINYRSYYLAITNKVANLAISSCKQIPIAHRIMQFSGRKSKDEDNSGIEKTSVINKK